MAGGQQSSQTLNGCGGLLFQPAKNPAGLKGLSAAAGFRGLGKEKVVAATTNRANLNVGLMAGRCRSDCRLDS